MGANTQTTKLHISSRQLAKASKSRHNQKKPQKQKLEKPQTLEHKPPTRKVVPPPPATPSPPPNPDRKRTGAFIGANFSIFIIGGSIGYAAYQVSQASNITAKTDPAEQEDVSNLYDKIASKFDKSVDSTETNMGITYLRQQLVSQAKGDILEVLFGTGRNLEYYDWNFKGHKGVGKVDTKGNIKKGKVRSLAAVDKSGKMLEIAHDKFSAMFPGILGVRWVIADASELGNILGPPRNANETSGNFDTKYDTVIQTFRLFFVRDPVALLKNLGNYVKEEEGRILLLEHGRAKYGWLNSLLDANAEKHAKQYGCWWNRDMGEIVEKSGLEVVKIDRPKWWHGGTTWWIELKKPKSEVVATEVAAPATVPPAPAAKPSTWWKFWS